MGAPGDEGKSTADDEGDSGEIDLRGSGIGLFEIRSRSCERVDPGSDREVVVNSASAGPLVSFRRDKAIGFEMLPWGIVESAGGSVDWPWSLSTEHVSPTLRTSGKVGTKSLNGSMGRLRREMAL